MSTDPLSILIVTHHRKSKMYNRPFPMAYHLSNRGHDVTLMVTADHARFRFHEEQIDGVHVIETPDLLWGRYRSGWDPWNTLRKFGYLRSRRKKFDLIHAHETRPSTILPLLAMRRPKQVPLLIDWNDWWGGKGGIIDEVRSRWQRLAFGWFEALFEERFRRVGEGTTAISEPLRQRAIALGVPAASTYVMRGGTHIESVPYASKEDCRARLGLPADDPLLGFSSLDSHLDMEMIFKAFRLILDERPSARLVITGSASSDVHATAVAHGIDANIVWTGFVSYDDLWAYLGSCDVCLLPLDDKAYNRGRWPNKLMDYITVGRPVVANPVGDIARTIADYEIGSLVGWDEQAFVTATLDLLNDPDRAAAMGERARNLAEGELAWHNLIVGLENFFQGMVNDAQH